MAESRIYTGRSPRGTFLVAGESVPYVRGVPVEVSAAVAKALDVEPGWSTVPKAKPPKSDSPDKSEGSEPDPKES